MKTALRRPLSVVALTLALLLIAAPVWAESRDKLLKRAAGEVRKGNFDVAEKIYRELVEQSAQDKEARLGLSFVMLKLAKLQATYDLAMQVLALEPLNARAHTLIGTALLRSGESRSSVEALFTALKLNEREALAYAG